MITTQIQRKLVSAAGRAVLCYVIILQAFLAAYGIAATAGQATDLGSSFVICHHADADTGSDPARGTTPHVPCVLCAVAATANALPTEAVVIAAVSQELSHRLRPVSSASDPTQRPWRSGLARAPPLFA